ncbi:hypothetical protein ACO1O0_006590 [Amphichorda felina]
MKGTPKTEESRGVFDVAVSTARKAAKIFWDDPQNPTLDSPGYELPREEVIDYVNRNNLGVDVCHAPGCGRLLDGRSTWCWRCSRRAWDIWDCLVQGARNEELIAVCDRPVPSHRAYSRVSWWRGGAWCPRCVAFARVMHLEPDVQFREKDEEHRAMGMSTYYSDSD